MWVSSGQSLYVTHDDGATWTTSPSGAAIVGATSFAFVSDSTGWALTENGYCANGKTGCGTKIALLRTTDGGASWTPVQVAGLTS